jgi:hypothetical protein
MRRGRAARTACVRAAALGLVTSGIGRADGGLVQVPPELQPVVDAVAPAVFPACGTAATGAFLVAIFGSQVPEQYNYAGAAFPVLGVIFLACGEFPTPADRSRCSIDDTLVVAVKQVPNGSMVPIQPVTGSVVDTARAVGKLATGGDDLAGLLASDAVIVQTLQCRSTAVVPVPEPPHEDEPAAHDDAGTIEGPPVEATMPTRVDASTSVARGASGGLDAAVEPAPAPASVVATEEVALEHPQLSAAPVGRRVTDHRGSWWIVGLALAATAWRFVPRALRRETDGATPGR